MWDPKQTMIESPYLHTYISLFVFQETAFKRCPAMWDLKQTMIESPYLHTYIRFIVFQETAFKRV